MGCDISTVQESGQLAPPEHHREHSKRRAHHHPKKVKAMEGQDAFEKYKKMFRFQDIIAEYGARDEKWTDDEFVPGYEILNKMGKSPPQWKDFVFKRATEFMDPKEIAVFKGIDPNDIRQGALGDCYMLCCLAALAERPNLVERLIITEEYNKVGCYAVWLCDAGTWKSVIVDDFFPVNRFNQPAFTKSNGPELWVLLIEKAYAKLFGGYDIIEGGLPQYALKDLTGAPYDQLESSDPNEVWNLLWEANKKDYLMTCYSKSTNIREERNPLGIVSGHAYSILDVREVVTEKETARILQIRNPWGKFEWKGAWGDHSSKWTPETIKQVPNFSRADDGTFWMSVDDFVTYYEGVGICKLHEDYFYQSIQLSHDKKVLPNFRARDDEFIPYQNPNRTVVRLHLEHKTHLFLSVNQTDDRKFLTSPSFYQYSNVRIMVARVTPDGLQYVAGANNTDRDVVAEATLGRGIYLVTIEIVWEQEHHKKFTLSAYSEHPVAFERVGNADFDAAERNIVKSLAIKNAGSRVKDYAAIQEPGIKRYMGSEFGLVYFCYHNRGTRTLKETVTMTSRTNLRICPPFNNNREFTVIVPPGADAVVIYKPVFAEPYSFSIKASFSAQSFFGDVMRHPSNNTVYHDDPEDVVLEIADNDCYNQFIKNDRDVFTVEEVKEDPPAGAEDDEETKVVISKVLGVFKGPAILLDKGDLVQVETFENGDANIQQQQQ